MDYGSIMNYSEPKLEKLIKEKFVLSKPTSYGLLVSLNKNKLKEIEEFIVKL